MEASLIPESEVEALTDEELRVHDWRAEQLCALGVPRMMADWFADRVDWRAVARLVERGCPLGLALEIAR